MISATTLPDGQLATLLAGGGDPTAITALNSAMRSRNLLLLRRLLELAENDFPDQASAANLMENFNKLSTIESEAPETTTEVVSHPHFGAWATICILRMSGNRHSFDKEPLWFDLGYLGAIVMTSAIRGGIEAEAIVPSHFGRVIIPSIGRITLADPMPWQMVTVRSRRDGTLTIQSTTDFVRVSAKKTINQARWEPIRHLTASCDGLAIDLELDDVDPYRDWQHRGASDRIADIRFSEWENQLSEAWKVLVYRHPDAAGAVAAGLRTLVPVSPQAKRLSSWTSRYSSGAAAVTIQSDGRQLAKTLIHEFQHTKLNLIDDIIPLVLASDPPLLYSPWRNDPRPALGLLQAIYASAAVTDFWRVERIESPSSPIVILEFARGRRQMMLGLQELTQCRALSSAGELLTGAMWALFDSWCSESVPEQYEAGAADLTLDHSIRWRLRNFAVSASYITRLASFWLDNKPPPKPAPMETVRGPISTPPAVDDTRLLLIYSMLAGHTVASAANWLRAADRADVRFAEGYYADAAVAYQLDIIAGNGRPEVWSGLAVSRQRIADDQTTEILVTYPQLVRALYEYLAYHSVEKPSPLEIAGWLSVLRNSL